MRDWRESRRCIAFLRFYFLTTERECHFPLSPAVCMYPIRFLLCRMFHAKGPGRRLGTSRVLSTCTVFRRRKCALIHDPIVYMSSTGCNKTLRPGICGILVARNKSSLKREKRKRCMYLFCFTQFFYGEQKQMLGIIPRRETTVHAAEKMEPCANERCARNPLRFFSGPSRYLKISFRSQE